jgi:ubiquinone biosynthesis protein
MQRDAREWHRLARAFPRDLNELLQRMRSGAFSVHLEHRRLDPVVNRLVLGLLTSSLLLGSSLLWSMNAMPLIRGVSLPGVVGYAVAVLMGLRLFGAIRRSERAPEDM